MSLPDGTCPECQFKAPLEAFMAGEDSADVIRSFAAMPGPPMLRKSLLRYLGLHAAPGRKVSYRRGAALLAELLPLIEEGRIRREGRAWPAPLEYWQYALDAIFAKPDLRRPLKGNGLLLQIIADHASSTEAKQERQAEDRRAGITPVGGVAQAAASTDDTHQARLQSSRKTIDAAIAAAKSITHGDSNG